MSWEVRFGSLKLWESISYHSSTAGLDDQRQPMVLELYCRKTGKKEKVERGQAWLYREGGGREREKEG